MPRPSTPDALVSAGYALAAAYVTSPLWIHLAHGGLTMGGMDEVQFEWFLEHGAQAVIGPHNPLFTTLMNVPHGVNLMANTSVIGLALILLPVTLLYGAHVAFVVALTGGLGATAFAWYWLFSRHLPGCSRAAAVLGGAFCGFAPAMISHANGAHLNFVSLYLLPLIVWRVMKLRDRGARNGLVLGCLVVVQFFVGAEPLFLGALGIAMFFGCYFVVQRHQIPEVWRSVLSGLATAAGVAGVLLAYPIWLEFWGPQSYRGLSVPATGNELRAFLEFPSQSIAGHAVPDWMALNSSEQNSFFGWPLLAVTAAAAIWLWQHVVARAAAITAVLSMHASLGQDVMWNGKPSAVHGIWGYLSALPVFDTLLPTRLTLITVPAIAVLLALGVSKFRRPRVGLALALVAMAPLFPKPLPTIDRPQVPAFFARGLWRQYVHPGGVVVSALPNDGRDSDPLRWQLATNLGFSMVGGYFLAPLGDDRRGTFVRAWDTFMSTVVVAQESSATYPVSAQVRAQALADLQAIHAEAVVLAAPNEPVRQTVDAILGPPRRVGGVWLWQPPQLVTLRVGNVR